MDDARVLVLGDSGSGKTTLAAALARRLDAPHIELDALFHQPGWQSVDLHEFRTQVAGIAATDRWIIDGNYRHVQDLLRARATSIVWLDLPLRRTIPRLVYRTWRRLTMDEELQNQNRERWSTVVNRDHPIWWTLRNHRARVDAYERLMDKRWVRLRSVAEIDSWLESLPAPRS